MRTAIDIRDRFRGMMLGTAVGDALGLPAEGISRRRIKKLYGGSWRHRFVLGRGMVSDDTDHTVFVAESLLAAPDASGRFARELARRLRWWLVSLPAGIGYATLRALIRLWIGMGPERSGVRSAGNGPAMRVAPIGAFFSKNDELRDEYVYTSTMLTHTDEKALIGSRAVVYVVGWAIREEPQTRPERELFLSLLRSAGPDNDVWMGIVNSVARAITDDLSVEAFADSLGCENGITGYIYHTVPVTLYAWWRHFGDFEKTLVSVLDCGGDTDTAGAIVGALAGAVSGESGIPKEWVKGICDQPHSVLYLRTLADGLFNVSEGSDADMRASTSWTFRALRNVVFLLIVLLHGFRRLLPPY